MAETGLENFSIKKLSFEELNNITKLLTDEERSIIASEQRQCFREMLLKRVAPFMIAAGGCTILAKRKFPTKVIATPLSISFIVIGAGVYGLGSSLRVCYDRVNPTVERIFKQYANANIEKLSGLSATEADSFLVPARKDRSIRESQMGTTDYDRKNFQTVSTFGKWNEKLNSSEKPENLFDLSLQTDDDSRKRQAMQELASSWTERDKKVVNSFLSEQPSYMPGTPTGPRKVQNSQYGDEGFS